MGPWRRNDPARSGGQDAELALYTTMLGRIRIGNPEQSTTPARSRTRNNNANSVSDH